MCRGRRENLAKARALMDSGNSTAANDCYQKAVDISPLTAKHFIEASCCNPKSAYDRSMSINAGCMHCGVLACQELSASPVARAAVPCNGSELSDGAGVECRP